MSVRRRLSGLKNSNAIYYVALAFVIFVWGLDPLIMSYFYSYYSASVLTAIGTFVSLLTFLFVCRKRLSQLTRRYFKFAVPIGLLNAAACLLQKIGLQYTTPANYAFLEHLSCVIVPIALLILIKKRPTKIQVFCCITCLVGCLVLCGLTPSNLTLGKGDALCALAGILFGVCIALTGVFVKDLDILLYMLIHMLVYFLTSVASAFALNLITVNGVPLEPLHFTADLRLLIPLALFGLISIGACWLLKNMATVHIDPTAVAIFSPFSAVISMMLSVMIGKDLLSGHLVVGGLIILLAVLLSGMNEIAEQRREQLRNI